MGSGVCSCCDLQQMKAPEISITSPKNKLSLLALNSLSSPKAMNPLIELQARIKLLESVNSSTVLKLKVINTGNLPKGTCFIIRSQGLESSSRQVKDGYTYFGCKRKVESVVTNDIIIPMNDSELTATQKGANFMIAYNVNKDNYTINDLGKGYSAFIKLTHALVMQIQALKDNWMINIGETFLVFSIEVVHLSPPRLTIKKFSGSENGNIKTFDASEYVNSFVTIGRGRNCDVELDDYLLSKVQCSIYYDLISGWSIVDGDYQAQKESTNGTWLYVAEETEIYNGMIFKAYQTVFQVYFI